MSGLPSPVSSASSPTLNGRKDLTGQGSSSSIGKGSQSRGMAAASSSRQHDASSLASAGPSSSARPRSMDLSAAPNGTGSSSGIAADGSMMRCGGCKKGIDQASGGVVVSFGNALWHVECFRCAKCDNRVTADTNLLLLSDGSPVCGNCSYQCYVCKQPITEEAIMTGDESYHAHCFTCRACSKRIEELVFAKTSQGIYCMACHNERVARSRRHAEAKKKAKERDKLKQQQQQARRQGQAPSDGMTSTSSTLDLQQLLGPDASTSRTSAAPPGSTPNGGSSSFAKSPSVDSSLISPSPSMAGLGGSLVGSPAGTPASGYFGHVATSASRPPPISPSPVDKRSAGLRADSPKTGISDDGSFRTANDDAAHRNGSALSSPNSTSPTVREAQTGPSQGTASSLDVPTARNAKRRSMNPQMVFDYQRANASPPISPSHTNDVFGQSLSTALPNSPLRSVFGNNDERRGSVEAISPRQTPANVAPLKLGGVSRSGIDKEEGGWMASNRNNVVYSSTPPRSSSLKDKGRHALDTPPTLDAPEIAALNFSSDPDFAVLLAENIRLESPEKAGAGTAAKGHTPNTAESSHSGGTLRATQEPDRAASSSHVKRKSLSLPTSPSPPPKDGLPLPHASPSATGRKRSATDLVLRDQDVEMPQQTSRSLDLPPQPFRTDSSSSAGSGDGAELQEVTGILQKAMDSARSGDGRASLELAVLQQLAQYIGSVHEEMYAVRQKYSGAKRSSQHAIEGLSVAGEVYEKEVAARLEAEAEVARLRARVHGQTARLSIIAGDEKRRESLRRQSQDLVLNLTGLEKDISKLQVEKDLTLAELQELANTKQRPDAMAKNPSELGATVARSLTNRFDGLRTKYKQDLEPLIAQREALAREIGELRDTRNLYLEESTALSAKNEELAELNTRLTKQSEALHEATTRQRLLSNPLHTRTKQHISGSPSMSSLLTAGASTDAAEDALPQLKPVRMDNQFDAAQSRGGRFKWYKSSKGSDSAAGSSSSTTKSLATPSSKGRPSQSAGVREHVFQQHSILRFSRCEHCGEKLWGMQELKCATCGIVCHTKCADKLAGACKPSDGAIVEEVVEIGPSMFGRDLSEQIEMDGQPVPVIVTKCIEAVEDQGMDYEGIYRKTGGSSLSKQITQLFERGDYDGFDLRDMDRFNDINSTTSVMKSYFRSLPNPLLTHDLHELFVSAASVKDPVAKHETLLGLIKQLPKDHYNTLKVLMMHLNRVRNHSGENLMSARNLGVVFGPTLMRSSDPAREFGDMAGKALSIEWMIDNAAEIFTPPGD